MADPFRAPSTNRRQPPNPITPEELEELLVECRRCGGDGIEADTVERLIHALKAAWEALDALGYATEESSVFPDRPVLKSEWQQLEAECNDLRTQLSTTVAALAEVTRERDEARRELVARGVTNDSLDSQVRNMQRTSAEALSDYLQMEQRAVRAESQLTDRDRVIAGLREHLTTQIGEGLRGTRDVCEVCSTDDSPGCPWADAATVALAHDAKVRREALEDAARMIGNTSANSDIFMGRSSIAAAIRRLATKEPDATSG